MRISLNQPMLAMLVGLAFTVPASCMACSLDPPDPMLLKQRMAKEIAFRLAIDVAQVPLTDPVGQVFERMWQPSYPEVEAI